MAAKDFARLRIVRIAVALVLGGGFVCCLSWPAPASDTKQSGESRIKKAGVRRPNSPLGVIPVEVVVDPANPVPDPTSSFSVQIRLEESSGGAPSDESYAHVYAWVASSPPSLRTIGSPARSLKKEVKPLKFKKKEKLSEKGKLDIHKGESGKLLILVGQGYRADGSVVLTDPKVLRIK